MDKPISFFWQCWDLRSHESSSQDVDVCSSSVRPRRDTPDCREEFRVPWTRVWVWSTLEFLLHVGCCDRKEEYILPDFRPKKEVSGFWSKVGFKIGAVTSLFFGNFSFVFAKTWYTILEPDQISHTQSIVAKRGLTNRANVRTPVWKCRLKHSTAEFQLIQQF